MENKYTDKNIPDNLFWWKCSLLLC